ncbi:hypothetical protein EVAR_95832_1 [Eumeta japonica]|uniref:Uncharacterized protein n=1 Tax=Eumeta variegata TaxID=151549 RepID=A0A4C1VLE1_EUMVA|nr:hypothetical protein EVAR_95832_1 [Eumeta japonica]
MVTSKSFRGACQVQKTGHRNVKSLSSKRKISFSTPKRQYRSKQNMGIHKKREIVVCEQNRIKTCKWKICHDRDGRGGGRVGRIERLKY